MTRPDEPRPDEPAAGSARPDDSRPGDGSVSAVLDGTATTAELARVAASPELGARLDAFRTVRDGLRPAPGEAERLGDGADDRIAVALGAWDPRHSADGRSVPAGAVVAATDGAEGGRTRGVAWLAAAAVVVLVAGIGVVVAQDGGDRRTDQARTEDAGSVPPAAAERGTGSLDAGSRDAAGADGSGPTTAGAAAAPSESSEAGSSEAGATASFLGSFSSRADLERAALAAATSSAGSGPPPACAAALAGPGAAAVGTALLGGRGVVVGVTGASSVVVLDALDCTPVA